MEIRCKWVFWGEWGWIAGAEALRQRGALCVLNRVVGGQRGDSACREVGDSVRFYSEMGNLKSFEQERKSDAAQSVSLWLLCSGG